MVEECWLNIETESKHVRGPLRENKTVSMYDHNSRHGLTIEPKRFLNSFLFFLINAPA